MTNGHISRFIPLYFIYCPRNVFRFIAAGVRVSRCEHVDALHETFCEPRLAKLVEPPL